MRTFDLNGKTFEIGSAIDNFTGQVIYCKTEITFNGRKTELNIHYNPDTDIFTECAIVYRVDMFEPRPIEEFMTEKEIKFCKDKLIEYEIQINGVY